MNVYTKGLAVMNSLRSAALGREARDRNTGRRHRALGLSSKGCALLGQRAHRLPPDFHGALANEKVRSQLTPAATSEAPSLDGDAIRATGIA